MSTRDLARKYREVFDRDTASPNAAMALAVLAESVGDPEESRKYWTICVERHLGLAQEGLAADFTRALAETLRLIQAKEGPVAAMGYLEANIPEHLDGPAIGLIRMHYLARSGRLKDARSLYRNCVGDVRLGEHFSKFVKLIPAIFHETKIEEWSDLLARLDRNSDVCASETMPARLMLLLALRRYGDFLTLTAGLALTGHRLEKFASARDQLQSVNGRSEGEGLVLCIGLSKTGTTSLAMAMSTLKYRSAHWINHFTGDLLSQHDTNIFNFMSDISVSHQFEDYFNLFPHAKYIYTTRELGAWSRSFHRHFLQYMGTHNIDEMRAALHHDIYLGKRRAEILSDLYLKYESCEEAYRAFDQRVRSFFQGRSANFLELDLTKGDPWEPLCSFLCHSPPAMAFPWENKSSGHR